MELVKSLIALTITLPLDAPKEDAIRAIHAIGAFFSVEEGLPPATAKNINDKIATEVGEFRNATGLPGLGAPAGPPTTVAAAANTSTITRDKNGLPWDERIHSSSKAFVQDGSWRKKKGVSDAMVTKVEAELRGAVSVNDAPAATGTLLPPPPSTTTTLPPPAAAPNPAFTEFVQFIAATPQCTPDWLTMVLRDHFGVPNGDMQNLAHMPDKIPQITASIKAALGIA